MKTKKNIKQALFKPFENPTYLIIHIQNRETIVKITLNDLEVLYFSLEFTFENTVFKKEFEKILTKERFYDSDIIEFEGIELSQIDKTKIANCLNEILDFRFS